MGVEDTKRVRGGAGVGPEEPQGIKYTVRGSILSSVECLEGKE